MEKRYEVVFLVDSTEIFHDGVYAENLTQLRRILMNDRNYHEFAVYPSENKYKWNPTVYSREKDPMIAILETRTINGKKEWVWDTKTRTSIVNKDGTLRKRRK